MVNLALFGVKMESNNLSYSYTINPNLSYTIPYTINPKMERGYPFWLFYTINRVVYTIKHVPLLLLLLYTILKIYIYNIIDTPTFKNPIIV